MNICVAPCVGSKPPSSDRAAPGRPFFETCTRRSGLPRDTCQGCIFGELCIFAGPEPETAASAPDDRIYLCFRCLLVSRSRFQSPIRTIESVLKSHRTRATRLSSRSSLVSTLVSTLSKSNGIPNRYCHWGQASASKPQRMFTGHSSRERGAVSGKDSRA